MPAIVLRDRKESRVLMPLKMKPVSAVWALRDILGGGHRLVDDQWRVVFGQGASNGIRIRPPNVFFPPLSPVRIRTTCLLISSVCILTLS